MKDINIAIIGANGFIGKNLCEYLDEEGYNLSIIGRNLNLHLNLKQSHKYFATDIHHTKELIDVLNHIEVVVWLVHASVPSTKDDSLLDDFNLNISPLIKFFEKSKNLGSLKKFIYLSSGGTIYGNSDIETPINELVSQKPISDYGLSKSIIESYIQYLTQDTHFESLVLRPSNVFGKYQNLVKPQGVIGFAFKSIRDDEYLNLYDNGRVIRDFIHVRDVSKAILKCILKPLIVSKTSFYNVSSGEGIPIHLILTMIEDITQKKIKLHHLQSRRFDCAYNVLDNSKIKHELGWQVETSLIQGLNEVWKWIQNYN